MPLVTVNEWITPREYGHRASWMAQISEVKRIASSGETPPGEERFSVRWMAWVMMTFALRRQPPGSRRSGHRRAFTRLQLRFVDQCRDAGANCRPSTIKTSPLHDATRTAEINSSSFVRSFARRRLLRPWRMTHELLLSPLTRSPSAAADNRWFAERPTRTEITACGIQSTAL